MASKSANISRLVVGDIFVEGQNNSIVPKDHILISDGDSRTHWNSVSSIFPVSSFRTVLGNDAVSFSADLIYNTLRISTSAIPSTFASYVDPTTSSLMLSLNFPPITIDGAAATAVTTTTTVQSPNIISSVTFHSTIKFYGVQDLKFSTVNTQRSVYVGISTFTAAGYSTLYGEMQNNRKVSVSSLSTSFGSPQSASFVSSIPFTSFQGDLSTAVGTSNVFFSSLQFDPAPFVQYVNSSNRRTTMSLEYRPTFVFSHMNSGVDKISDMTSTMKKITTFLQIGATVFPESSTIRYITSQNISTTTFNQTLSNVYADSIRMNVSSYQLSSLVGNSPPGTTAAVYHRIDNVSSNALTNASLDRLDYRNMNESQNVLFMTLNNEPIVATDAMPPSYPGHF
jgi:hypothetical protein